MSEDKSYGEKSDFEKFFKDFREDYVLNIRPKIAAPFYEVARFPFVLNALQSVRAIQKDYSKKPEEKFVNSFLSEIFYHTKNIYLELCQKDINPLRMKEHLRHLDFYFVEEKF
jgi:hypothetical protein